MQSTQTSAFVRSLRQQLGLTQEQFASLLGVTFPTVNRWENGHARPSPLALKQLIMLSQSLEVVTNNTLEQAISGEEAKVKLPTNLTTKP